MCWVKVNPAGKKQVICKKARPSQPADLMKLTLILKE